MSIKPVLSSRAWNGPPPPLSLSAFLAHTLQLIDWSSSAPKTKPKHIKNTDTMVSREISSGKLAVIGGSSRAD